MHIRGFSLKEIVYEIPQTRTLMNQPTCLCTGGVWSLQTRDDVERMTALEREVELLRKQVSAGKERRASTADDARARVCASLPLPSSYIRRTVRSQPLAR